MLLYPGKNAQEMYCTFVFFQSCRPLTSRGQHLLLAVSKLFKHVIGGLSDY